MNLYFLRHGTAVQRGTLGMEDAERSLTSKGEARLWRITEAMKALDLSFEHIFSSPHRRARQTAEIVTEALGEQKNLALLDTLTPNGDAQKLIEHLKRLRPEPENALLVGHEPYLSSLISRLVCGRADLRLEMKKGGLCKLTIASLRYGRCASLNWLITPRQMELMRR